jgi:M6 family metalloprotease-like protein
MTSAAFGDRCGFRAALFLCAAAWLLSLAVGLPVCAGEVRSPDTVHSEAGCQVGLLEWMPPHPDLVRKLGRSGLAALTGEATPARMYTEMRDQRAKSAPTRISGTGTCLVILWEFTDHPADQVNHPNSAYVELLFSGSTLPTGSMNDFFLENSHGAYGVAGDVIGWTTSEQPYSFYEPHDASTTQDMIADAIAQLDPTVDFSLYDNDGPDGIPSSGDDDGYVDALFFVHAGPGQEQTGDPNDIWSHAWSFWNGLSTNDGVAIRRYSVEPEEHQDGGLVTVGVFCHEYGHVLGLPDLYDTDYSSSGIGEWGLMSGGSWTHRPADPPGSSPAHLTAWCKKELGWVVPTVITTTTLAVTIPPAETNAVAYRIFRGGATSGDEYFLCENRRNVGFDEGLVRRQILLGLPMPEGLIIYHIDESNSSNTNDTQRLVDVVEASPWFRGPGDWYETLDGPRDTGLYQNLSQFNRGDNGDLWPGFTAFNADSTDWVAPRDRNRFADDSVPPAEDHFCDPTGIAVQNIALAGDDVLADFIIGAYRAENVLPPDAQAVWDFEAGTDGWQFCRSFVHHDLLYGDGCPGTGGLWFGLDNPDFDCPPGYGNNWNDFTWHRVAAAAGASITIRHKYDMESGYDFAHLEVRCASDPQAPWHELAEYTGTSGCVTQTYPIPPSILSECEDPDYGLALLDLRLRFTSDGAWSAEDGRYCGLGWWVDEVSVEGTVTAAGDATPGVGLPAQLLPAFPNPFNPSTVLRFHVPAGSSQVGLTIYDQRGRKVRDLVSSVAAAGWLEAVWDGCDETGKSLASGIYFARLDVDGLAQVQKLALLK